MTDSETYGLGAWPFKVQTLLPCWFRVLSTISTWGPMCCCCVRHRFWPGWRRAQYVDNNSSRGLLISLVQFAGYASVNICVSDNIDHFKLRSYPEFNQDETRANAGSLLLTQVMRQGTTELRLLVVLHVLYGSVQIMKFWTFRWFKNKNSIHFPSSVKVLLLIYKDATSPDIPFILRIHPTLEVCVKARS